LGKKYTLTYKKLIHPLTGTLLQSRTTDGKMKMKQTLLLQKRSVTSLMFSAILIASMFLGISAAPIANIMQNAFTPPLFPMEPYRPLFEGANEPHQPSIDRYANFDGSLHSYLDTGIIPENVLSRDNHISVIMGAGYRVDLDEVSRFMDIRHVIDMGMGLMIQGDVASPKDLLILDEVDYTGMMMADELLEYPSAEGSGTPVMDQFFVNEIIAADDAHTAGYDGTGTVISITDTGVDFTVSDLADAYHTNSSGYPTAFDPGGLGVAPTSWSGSPVSGYLLTAGYDFDMWFAIYPSSAAILHSNSTYGVLADNLWVGVGPSAIPSLSGTYKVGIALTANSGGPRTRQFFVFLLTDPNSAGVYDTMYIDWETSYAVTANYNGWPTPPLPADWDFTNNVYNGKYDFDPGTGDADFLMAYDANGDGYNDFGLGLLATTYDYWGVVIPSWGMLEGIDAAGRGFAFHFDPGGHGTSCAGTAAGRGIQPFDVYNNGTDYYLLGVAPGAKLMSTNLFSWGNTFTCWAWACGYRPVTTWGVEEDWDSWTHTTNMAGWDDTNQAHIVHGSWGYPYRTLGAEGYIVGADWNSFAIDFFSTGALGFPYYNASGGVYSNPNWPDGSIHDSPLFVISSGNEGVGYGTHTNPSGPAVLVVGASSTSHYAQDVYNPDGSLGPQGYDQMAFYSSAGPTPTALPKVDVCAPGFAGYEVMPLWRGHAEGTGPFRRFGGTSMASPVACGVAALVFEAIGIDGDFPQPLPYGFDGGWVKTIVKSTAEDLSHPVFRQGAGRVNAYKAVEMADGSATALGDDLIQMWCNHTFMNYANAYETNDTAAEIWLTDPVAALALEGQEPWWNPYGFGAAYVWTLFMGWHEAETPQAGYFHPGAHGRMAPNVTMMDAGFAVNDLHPGESTDVGFIAATGSLGTLSPGDVGACWYELVAEDSASFFSTAPSTTYPLFGTYPGITNFDTAFMNQFLAADYAEIILTSPFDEFLSVFEYGEQYTYVGDTNYVFLFDWNDTNNDGILDYASDTNPGEIRRIDTDQSGSNVLKMCIGNPGAQWMGNKNATIYYRDRGIEAFLYRQLEVGVTIRLYNKVEWDWFTISQESDPLQWTATIDVPSGATPGFYAGFINMSLGNNVEYFPVLVNVIADMVPGTPQTWGGTDGHPYDNGAIGPTRWDLDGRQSSGDWRFYYIDVDYLDDTTWVMVNVTWHDPDTILDVYLDAGHYGNHDYLTVLGGGAVASSDTAYLDYGRWDSRPSWDRTNVILTDYSIFSAGARYGSDLARDNSPHPPLIISVHCVQRGGMYPLENISITVSTTNWTMDPYSNWWGPTSLPLPVGYINETSTMDPVTDDSIWSGEHITFNGTFEPWGFTGLNVPWFLTDMQALLGDDYYWEDRFVAANASGYSGIWPDPDVYYELTDVVPGMVVYAECDQYDGVGGPGAANGADLDMGIYDPNFQLVGSSGNAGSHEWATITARAAGSYWIGIDYFGDDSSYGWGGWDYLPFWVVGQTRITINNPAAGPTALWDTHQLGLNMVFDCQLKMITGTSLDRSTYLVEPRTNVSVTNFFPPTLSLVSPIAGDTEGPDPFWFNWTASDPNSDETLGFSVEVSNDNGANWTLAVPGTTALSALWDPNGFYGLEGTDQMLFRVNCTDGIYTVSRTSGIFTVVPLEAPPPPPPYELYIVIAVIVIVVIILLATCLLKRRQVAKT
jgi:subtilisin family serine protease